MSSKKKASAKATTPTPGTKAASGDTKPPSPGEVQTNGADTDAKKTPANAPVGDSNKPKTADEKEQLAALAEKGATTPPGSDDKQSKGIEPADNPAQRIDEMTNEEAKAFSDEAKRPDLPRTDEARPASTSDVLNPATGRRNAETEDNYRAHYSRGWNDRKNNIDNRHDYPGGSNAAVEDKSAYLAGWQGCDRELSIGHAGGDMKRGEFERARTKSLDGR